MNRKDFVKTISAISLLPYSKPLPLHSGSKSPDIIKPIRLKKGDTIALAVPGSYISENELQDSITNLNELGFNVVYPENILAKHGYFAGEDQLRADDLNRLFRRKDVKAIMCARGGYGCARILPLLDYDAVKNNPKILIGYSDVTALLYGIYKKTGMVCFHGPVGISTYNEFSRRYFEDTLMNPANELLLVNSEDEKDARTINSGNAEGILIGGNLSLVVSLIGTEYDLDTKDKIIFLEEIGEEPYRIDRMITQMLQAGKFEGAAGVVLGVFSKCEPKKKDPEFESSFSLFEVLEDRFHQIDIPVVYGMSFGHITNKFTLPFGVHAELDSVEKTITLLEPAVL